MSAKIQNEDVDSAAELVTAGGTASQLTNDDKIWVKAGSIDKTLDQAIVDGDIGSGAPRSEVWAYGYNGYGSVDTVINRFSTVGVNIGSSISYVDSVQHGATFTINTTGVYALIYINAYSTNAHIGVSRNAAGSELTTDIQFITDAHKLGFVNNSSGGYLSFSIKLNLTAGDVIRAHGQTAGIPDGGTDPTNAQFRIVQISN